MRAVWLGREGDVVRVLRPSSLHDYAAWYLAREGRKGDCRPIPDDPEQQVHAMRQRHCGKMRPWFTAGARWNIVSLDLLSDFSNLVFLESKWTKDEGLVILGDPNYRLLERVAKNAVRANYLDRPSARCHKKYYDDLQRGSLRLEGENRIAICSAEDSERRSNPAAQYYLLDGVGRSLPYMILITEKQRKYEPIEAFLAEKASALWSSA